MQPLPVTLGRDLRVHIAETQNQGVARREATSQAQPHRVTRLVRHIRRAIVAGDIAVGMGRPRLARIRAVATSPD